jgi:hypothetical protein
VCPAEKEEEGRKLTDRVDTEGGRIRERRASSRGVRFFTDAINKKSKKKKVTLEGERVHTHK